MQFLIIRCGKERKVAGEQEVAGKLARRAHRNLHETREFWVCPPAAAFREIGFNGHARTADLGGKAVQLFSWKSPREPVRVQTQNVRFLPDAKSMKFLIFDSVALVWPRAKSQ